jgi:hypothetical protein
MYEVALPGRIIGALTDGSTGSNLVLIVVRLDNPRDDAREQGPMDFAAFTWTPGGKPMAFVRCYTGADGQSHFEDLDLLPPDMERSIEQTASSITFTRSPNGRFSD